VGSRGLDTSAGRARAHRAAILDLGGILTVREMAEGVAHRSPAGSNSPPFVDTLNRILGRVKDAWSDGSPNGRRSVASLADEGPLTAAELAELSLLCTRMEQSYPSQARSPMVSGSGKLPSPVGLETFAVVEADDLVSVLELLRQHVSLACRVNLIDEAIEVMKPEPSPSGAANAFQQVRS
jgi:hypothetical protein